MNKASFFDCNYNCNIKSKKPVEIIVFLIFIVASIIISIFHEPWFDESQAWQIAKCASYKDILFFLPHYECHPPLWTLILSIPAKLGIPYEIGLKTIGLLTSFANAFIIIFKSHFPRIVRILLPFNFFLFYQYGIIVRPYGLLILLLLFLAILFPQKDVHPWRFTLVLILLCCTHAYGLLIAGGVAICLVWDLICEKGLKSFFSGALKDKRTLALIVLLISAILVIIDIFPQENTISASVTATNSLVSRLLCMLFTMIPDCLIFRSEWFSSDAVLLKKANIEVSYLIIACFIGAIIWFILWLVSTRKKFKYLVVPYCIFSVFGAFVYITAHHIGVSLGILIWGLWINLEDPQRFENWRRIKLILKTNPLNSKVTRIGLLFLGAVCILMPIYWTLSSSIRDVNGEYSYGRGMAKFIKNNELDNLTIYVAWNPSFLSEDEKEYISDQVFVSSDPTLLAYFENNILDNVPNKSQAYKLNKCTSIDEAKELASEWAKKDPPDIIIGSTKLSSVYKDKTSIPDYSIVYVGFYNYYYKDSQTIGFLPVYMKDDLIAQYGLEVANTSDLILPYYLRSEEMVEAYNNGELTVDEIINMTFGSVENDK